MAAPTYLTLAESAKSMTSALDMAVHNTFRESILLNSLSFKTVTGASVDYANVTALPTPATRALNQTFSVSQGQTAPGNEPLKIYGGRIGSDTAGEQMGILDPVEQTIWYARAMRLLLEYDFIYGDKSTDPLQVRGLQDFAETSTATTDTSISAGTTSGGAALSLRALRDAIDNCRPGATHLVMSDKMRNLLTGASEATGVSGYVTHEMNDFGKRVFSFDGLPIIVMERNHLNQRILDFTEAASTGASTATSIYVISHVPEVGYFPGQNGTITTTPIARTTSQNVREMQWLINTVRVDPRAVVRIKHIGNLAMTS